MNNIEDLKNPVTDLIYNIVNSVKPYDELESEHILDVLNWIKSGAQLFRIEKPDIPNKHLVSYFALIDKEARKILLVDHKKSGLWLPSGGHVDPNENPKDTTKRECVEELNIEAEFLLEDPIFITSTITVGMTAGHTDISLWYILKGDHTTSYKYDKEEFNTVKWFSFDEIPYERTDIHMGRFMNKLQYILKNISKSV